MQAVHGIKELRSHLTPWRKKGERLGLVPTMGFLHEGHLSLIKRAKAENERVVVSIFVNPTQFGPNEDFASYPRDMEKDLALCAAEGVDLVFCPTAETMYPAAASTYVDMDSVKNGLCGASRPGHFRGVCTVVSKLFNIVQPDVAYFGQKDAQQVAVIKRMVTDLNIPVRIVPCPIIREEDGLAKSSRNTYLSPEERKAALVLSKAVFAGQAFLQEKGEAGADELLGLMQGIIEQEPLAKIDYIEAVNCESIEKLERICAPALVALAVYIGKTRLIDNFIFTENQ